MNKVVDAAEAAEELRRHFFAERFPLGGGVVAGPRSYGVYTSSKEYEDAKAEVEAEVEAEADLPLTREEQRRLEVYGERIRRLRLRRRASAEDEDERGEDEKRRRLLRSAADAVRAIREESEDSSPTAVAASRSEAPAALDPEAAHHRRPIVAVGLKHWLR